MSEAVLLRQPPRPEETDADATQRLASALGASVWVAASAGSGKTTVLTKRVMRLLLSGVLPQRILCLTFTRAAAAEMAIRVTEGLSHWATCSDDELRESLDALQGHAPAPEQLPEARRLFARLLACPGGMRIRTIHAFCQEVLRRFPIEAGLPPHFAVIEEGDARALQEDVRGDLLREAARAKDTKLGRALRLLVRDLGERGFAETMRNVLAERARFQAAIAEAGDLDALIVKMRARLELAPEDSEENLCRAAVDERALPLKAIRDAAQKLTEGSPTFAARGAIMLGWLELPLDERAASFEDYAGCFFTGKGEPYAHFAGKELLKKYPGLDDVLRREAARLASIMERIDAARMAESTEAILALGEEWMDRYEKRKAAQALLDYDDLVIRAEALLRREGIAPWVLYKLDGGLDHILVDEAQDTSRAQWNIIASLAEEFFAGSGARDDQNRTLFVVGDEKQSIFSFQHADPAAFAAMRAHFETRIVEAGKSFREVPLHVSFRSAPAILRAVDRVFADPAARDGVSAEPPAHYPHEGNKVGRVEVWPLIPAAERETESDAWQLPLDYEKARDPEAELADLIAARIANWLAQKERLLGRGRIQPGDIMILLRRRGRFADLMVRALKERKIPVTGVDRMKLVGQLAVMDLLALVQFALLSEDDLNLATVLRGPLLGLSEDQLMALAIGRKGTLWQSLTAKAARDPVLKAAHDYLSRVLATADFMTPFAMLARMLNETCPAGKSGKEALWARLGPDALDPIDELLNAAQEFSRRHAPSLQAFLHWLIASEAEVKRELDRKRDDSAGQVKIMTVHAAKGLEAPIVFLPDAAGVPREMDRLLWDAGTGAPLYVPKKPQAGLAWLLWEDARREQMREYRRLLYVALTRAADRLYIGGWEMKHGDGGGESWHALAKGALEPMHEEYAIEKGQEPQPLIAFADPDVPAAGEKAAAVKKAAMVKLPLWARRMAPAEPPAPRAVAPSKIAAFAAPFDAGMDIDEPPTAPPDRLFARGRIIHRLLESLPEMEDAKRDDAAARFLSNPQHDLAKKEQEEIAKEVLGILRDPEFAPLFGPESRAEVPLAAHIGLAEIAGAVDRLCVKEDGVWIVDYKSNRPPPVHVKDVPEAYSKQLASYRDVLRKVYPGKPVWCFLLWTYGPRLMEIPDRILDA